MNVATVQASCFAQKYGPSRTLVEAVIATLLPEVSVPADFMGEALLARLKAASAVTDIVGQRIYWQTVPQTQPPVGYPRVVLFVISGERPEHLEAEADPGGPNIVFWRGSVSEPRDLGDQSGAEGFIFHAAADLTVRWDRAAA